MNNLFRGAVAGLMGTLLAGGAAFGQLGTAGTCHVSCRAPAPSCAVAQVPCVPTCAAPCVTAAARGPINYEVQQKAPPCPRLPVRYELVGAPCAPISCAPGGCAEIPCAGHAVVRKPPSCAVAAPSLPCAIQPTAPPVSCAPVSCAPVSCAPVSCAPVGCVPVGCTQVDCANGSCPLGSDDGCFLGLGSGTRDGTCGPLEVLGSGICQVGGNMGDCKENFRKFHRNWDHHSTDWHRHLNYPIVSPARRPGYGYNRTCWRRYPEGTLWCPPCYGINPEMASPTPPPQVYPPRATNVPTTATPPAPEPFESAEPAPELPPAAPPAQLPSEKEIPYEPAPAASNGTALPPTASAAQWYSTTR